MSYQSLFFLIFTAAALLVYYAVPYKVQPWVLTAASILFYLSAGAKYLPFIAVTLISTYLCGLFIGRIYEKSDILLSECSDSAQKKEIRNAAKKKAKRFLILSLVVSIALLAVCKYTAFSINNVNKLLHLVKLPEITVFKIILPLGISFYTFMAISYVLDIYWKRYKAEKNILIYSAFLLYFPHVVQGPIDRFNEFKDQIKNGVPISYKNLTHGAQLALWGFFKKLVIADRLGIFVNKIFDEPDRFNGSALIVALAVYSIQIYADFSGCIDIVSGVSEAFGIKLRKNFNHPYFSRTMAEFWRRWHISLQEFFKDYVYFPVSASAFTKKVKKKLKAKGLKRLEELFTSCFPILIVWLITGIWHGAAWTFIIWGLFHAALLIGSQIFEPLFAKLTKLLRINTDNFGWHFLQMARTFTLCCIGRIFFRAAGIGTALGMIKKILTDTSLSALVRYKASDFGLTVNDVRIMVISVIVLLIADILQEKMPLRETLAKQNIIFRWIIIFAGLFAVIIFGVYGPGYDASSFIYEKF